MSKLCALCQHRPVVEAYRPFCSRRCADVDLQRWFTGAYAVPVEEEDSAAPPADPEGSA